MKLLVLRPEPGASRTAVRARERGLDPVLIPLFSVSAVPGPAPDPGRYDAVLLTSANGARFARAGLERLPCFAVGEVTASAAREAGFADVRTGPSDGAAAAAMVARDGMKRALHLCGRDHVALEAPGVSIERRIVYAAEPLATGPITGPAVALVHSARAGARLAELASDRSTIALAAISAGAAAAAGEGWSAKVVAAEPRDDALLEVAAQLCNHGAMDAKDRGDGI
ncbi:MAG: uroporphyrinogen-III synthase [Allosphingosinicella sp.]